MQKKQNGFKIVYQETKLNPIKSFTMQTKSKSKAIDYAKKFTTHNKFKLIEVLENVY